MQFLILARLLTNTAVAGTNHSLSTNGLFDANTAGDRFDRWSDKVSCHHVVPIKRIYRLEWPSQTPKERPQLGLRQNKFTSQKQSFQKGLQRTPIQQEPNYEVSTSVMSWWHSNPTCMVPLIKVLSCRGKEIHRSSEYSHNKQRMRLQMSHTPLCCTNLVYPSCAVCRFDTFLHTGREPTARD